MALRLPNPAKLLSVLAAFGVALGIFVLLNGSPPSGGGEPSAKPDARSYAALAARDLQKVRETGDPSYYSKASGLIARALRMDPRDPDALVGAGTLALARHDFRAGLRYGMHAHRVAPELVASYPVIVDAQVELGRYGAAERTLQRMVDLKPNLAAYARVSYFRELHGDLPGALAAMRLAVSAGGAAGENAAYVQTLAGNLQLQLGQVAAARASYRGALERFGGYVPALAGLARVDVARGRLAAAIRRYRVVVDRLPLPEYVIGLSEAELVAGRRAAARRDFGLVRAEQRLLAANGVNTDVDLALFEADHGSPARGVRLARRAWAAAPSVRSADALGWSLTRAGRPAAARPWIRRALALGSRDPSFLYHAGQLRRAYAGRAALSPLAAHRVRQALR